MKAQYISRILNQFALGGGDMMLSNIVKMETGRGFTVRRPGEVAYFPRNLWKPSSIISETGNRVRIVLVEAKMQKSGALRRLVDDIQALDKVPVIVEPHDRLAASLAGWGWRHRRHGVGIEFENIWYPRP